MSRRTRRPATRQASGFRLLEVARGLTDADRFALCDAHHGLMGRFPDGWRRQTLTHFTHADDTIARLVAAGLMVRLDGDVAHVTHLGRRLANELRRRRLVTKAVIGRAAQQGLVVRGAGQ